MPEYLAPGVYVEEVSFRSKSIEGVGTTTTGFIGPTRNGPIDMVPDIVTSLGEFERVYGDREQLQFHDLSSPVDNYVWHAVRAFFEEGGQLLYVMRVFSPIDPASDDGHARASLIDNDDDNTLHIQARFPGDAGNIRMRFTVRLSQNILSSKKNAQGQMQPSVSSLLDEDVVLYAPQSSPATISTPYIAGTFFDPAQKAQSWRFQEKEAASTDDLLLDHFHLDAMQHPIGSVRVVTLMVTTIPQSSNEVSQVWDGLAIDPSHQRNGAPDSLSTYFAEEPTNTALARSLPIIITSGKNIKTGLDVLQAIHNAHPDVWEALEDPTSTDEQRSFYVTLEGGNDGIRPLASDYEGKADPDTTVKTGLKAFEDLDDISIVAAPGSTFGFEDGYRDEAETIQGLLIAHAELMRYRIAVLDSGDGQSISLVRALRARLDSSYAALYYPWIRILDPVTNREINIPPSGAVAGIYARNDVNRGVYKAPANEVVNIALSFETMLNKAQQEVLNPEGVNCFRFFEGRGMRLWGARTISSDPEWKYVNLRRYFAYLEHSIDKGTQWAVFEPNGDLLWANVRRTIGDFLLNEWQNGALLGDKPEKAYFVRCDRTTMTQNDLDNGRLVCLIGVAPIRPAEFVIFRIGQWTADSK